MTVPEQWRVVSARTVRCGICQCPYDVDSYRWPDEQEADDDLDDANRKFLAEMVVDHLVTHV